MRPRPCDRPGFARLFAITALLLCLPLAAPARAGWDTYKVILWQDHGPAARRALPALGVDAGLIVGQRGTFDAAALRRSAETFTELGLGFYVENIATDFYAAYHRWTPEHPVEWAFRQTKARFLHDPMNPANFLRMPSLADAAWQARIAARLAAHAATLADLHPLYYSLGDETGIADLAAAWDFDVAPASLAGFRVWLHGQYGSLAALNAEWGTRFADWSAVQPETTDSILRCTEGRFAPWADFKAWMDVAFARAVQAGTEAVHEGDPQALAALEGGQVPGWGGYDYTLLAPALDAMEIYGAGEAPSLARAFHPGLVVLATSFGLGPREAAGVWRAALLGSRGTIIWDSEASFVRPDGTPGPRARTLAPVFADLHGEVGRRLIAAVPVAGPAAVLYSPESFRLAWALDRQAEARATGADWAARDAAREDEDSPWRDSLVAAAESLRRLGMPPRFVSPAMLEAGALRDGAIRVLLLPRAVALADAAVAAIRAFAAHGGLVLADAPPGRFDARGTRREALPLAAVARLLPGFAPRTLEPPLASAGATAAFPLAGPDGQPPADVATFLYRDGNATLLALHRDLPAEGPLPPPETVAVTLPRPALVRDLRGTAAAVRTGRVVLHLDAVTPALLQIGPD